MSRKIDSYKILTGIIVLCSCLSTAVFLIYRTDSWPSGREPVACAVSTLSLLLMIYFLTRAGEKIKNEENRRITSLGLLIGLLWTAEISVNNFIHPGIPLRDIIDDSFWALVGMFILIISAIKVYKTDRFMSGIVTGFWTGLGSGAVACLSALLLIVFGMRFILLDPLNLKEWTDVRNSAGTSQIDVYFAYQSYAGAIMHLYVLGIIMGLLLGVIGGATGKAMKAIVNSYCAMQKNIR